MALRHTPSMRGLLYERLSALEENLQQCRSAVPHSSNGNSSSDIVIDPISGHLPHMKGIMLDDEEQKQISYNPQRRGTLPPESGAETPPVPNFSSSTANGRSIVGSGFTSLLQQPDVDPTDDDSGGLVQENSAVTEPIANSQSREAELRVQLSQLSHSELVAISLDLYKSVTGTLNDMEKGISNAEVHNELNSPTSLTNENVQQLPSGASSVNPELTSIHGDNENEVSEASNSPQPSPAAPGLTLMVPEALVEDAVQHKHQRSSSTGDSSLKIHVEGNDIPFLIGIDRISGSDSDSDGEFHEMKTSRSVCSSTTIDGYETINEYMVIDTIGEGQYGRVLLAINEQTQEPRAIKVLPKKAIKRKATRTGGVDDQNESSIGRGTLNALATSLLSSGGFSNCSSAMASVADGTLNDIRNEVAIMKKLRHKNIVALYEVIDDPEEGSLYLVMQYAENGTLLTFNDTGECDVLAEEAVQKYLKQLVAALSYLERHKVVHRDIKPDNILLTKNDDVMIGDFGLSEMVDSSAFDESKSVPEDSHDVSREESTASSTFKTNRPKNKLRGTPAFMSPEVLRGDDVISHASDVWSLGVTTFSMLWGRLPFSSSSWRETVRCVMETEPRYPDGADPSWVDLVSGMLDKNPQTRTTLSALRRHPLVREGRRTPSTGSITPMMGSFALSPGDLDNVFTAKEQTTHDYSPHKPMSPTGRHNHGSPHKARQSLHESSIDAEKSHSPISTSGVDLNNSFGSPGPGKKSSAATLTAPRGYHR